MSTQPYPVFNSNTYPPFFGEPNYQESRFVIELTPGVYLVNQTETTPHIGEARHYPLRSAAMTVLNTKRRRYRKEQGWPWLWASVHELEEITTVRRRSNIAAPQRMEA